MRSGTYRMVAATVTEFEECKQAIMEGKIFLYDCG